MKDIDTIVEVDKFNPYHDALGRFASANSFRSFSANPKTTAGRNAIARQVKTQRNTFNRHKESKGENVWQNYHWIQGGKFPGRRKPVGYTGQTSNNGLTTRAGQNFGQKQTASKPKTTSKPAASSRQSSTNRHTSSNKPASTSRHTSSSKPKSTSKPSTKPKSTSNHASGSQKPSRNNKMVNGKDMTRRIDLSQLTPQKAMDFIAKQQGYKGQGRIIKSHTEFGKAVKKSGVVMYRTLGDGTDVNTGRHTSASKFIDYLKKGREDQLSLNGSGGSWYGQGIYTASTRFTPGKKPSTKKQIAAAEGSIDYKARGQGKTVAMTLDPSAKVGKYDDLYYELKSLSAQDRKRFSDDVGVYAAAKGYDAITKEFSDGTNYTMVYNRTKLIFFDQIYDNMMSYDLSFNSTKIPVGAF